MASRQTRTNAVSPMQVNSSPLPTSTTFNSSKGDENSRTEGSGSSTNSSQPQNSAIKIPARRGRPSKSAEHVMEKKRRTDEHRVSLAASMFGPDTTPQSPKKANVTTGRSTRGTDPSRGGRTLRSREKQPKLEQKKVEFKCTQCKKSFPSKSSVNRHFRWCTPKKPKKPESKPPLSSSAVSDVDKPASPPKFGTKRGRPPKTKSDAHSETQDEKMAALDQSGASTSTPDTLSVAISLSTNAEALSQPDASSPLPLSSLCEEVGLNDSAGDIPVRCTICKNTYRTGISYRKHLSNCTHYSSSSGEEEGEEEADHMTGTTTPTYTNEYVSSSQSTTKTLFNPGELSPSKCKNIAYSEDSSSTSSSDESEETEIVPYTPFTLQHEQATLAQNESYITSNNLHADTDPVHTSPIAAQSSHRSLIPSEASKYCSSSDFICTSNIDVCEAQNPETISEIGVETLNKIEESQEAEAACIPARTQTACEENVDLGAVEPEHLNPEIVRVFDTSFQAENCQAPPNIVQLQNSQNLASSGLEHSQDIFMQFQNNKDFTIQIKENSLQMPGNVQDSASSDQDIEANARISSNGQVQNSLNPEEETVNLYKPYDAQLLPHKWKSNVGNLPQQREDIYPSSGPEDQFQNPTAEQHGALSQQQFETITLQDSAGRIITVQIPVPCGLQLTHNNALQQLQYNSPQSSTQTTLDQFQQMQQIQLEQVQQQQIAAATVHQHHHFHREPIYQNANQLQSVENRMVVPEQEAGFQHRQTASQIQEQATTLHHHISVLGQQQRSDAMQQQCQAAIPQTTLQQVQDFSIQQQQKTNIEESQSHVMMEQLQASVLGRQTETRQAPCLSEFQAKASYQHPYHPQFQETHDIFPRQNHQEIHQMRQAEVHLHKPAIEQQQHVTIHHQQLAELEHQRVALQQQQQQNALQQHQHQQNSLQQQQAALQHLQQQQHAAFQQQQQVTVQQQQQQQQQDHVTLQHEQQHQGLQHQLQQQQQAAFQQQQQHAVIQHQQQQQLQNELQHHQQQQQATLQHQQQLQQKAFVQHQQQHQSEFQHQQQHHVALHRQNVVHQKEDTEIPFQHLINCHTQQALSASSSYEDFRHREATNLCPRSETPGNSVTYVVVQQGNTMSTLPTSYAPNSSGLSFQLGVEHEHQQPQPAVQHLHTLNIPTVVPVTSNHCRFRNNLSQAVLHVPSNQFQAQCLGSSSVQIPHIGSLMNSAGSNASPARPCPCPDCHQRVSHGSAGVIEKSKINATTRKFSKQLGYSSWEQCQPASSGNISAKRTKSLKIRSQLASIVGERQGQGLLLYKTMTSPATGPLPRLLPATVATTAPVSVSMSNMNFAASNSNVNAPATTDSLFPPITTSTPVPEKVIVPNPNIAVVHPLQKMSDQILQMESTFSLIPNVPNLIPENWVHPSDSSSPGISSAKLAQQLAEIQATLPPPARSEMRTPLTETVSEFFYTGIPTDPRLSQELNLLQSSTSVTQQQTSSHTRTTPQEVDSSISAASEVNNRPPVPVATEGTNLKPPPIQKSIKVTLKRQEGADSYSLLNVSETGNEAPGTMRSLKIKGKITSGEQAGSTTDVVVLPIVHTIPIPDPDVQESNRTIVEEDSGSGRAGFEGTVPIPSSPSSTMRLTHRAVVVYEVRLNDTVVFRSSDVRSVWANIFETVQGRRLDHNLPPLSYPATNISLPENKRDAAASFNQLGLTHRAIQFLLQQLPGINKAAKENRVFKFHKPLATSASVAGCDSESEESTDSARSRGYAGRKPFDMFGWLASKHRQKKVQKKRRLLETSRSTELPLAMKFRNLHKHRTEHLSVYCSSIHGRGLFTTTDIECGDMIIEYAGEIIRSVVCDVRDKFYESRGIGCYMFRIDDHYVIDATLKGNAARFINHSCNPNCHSKVMEISGKKHIVIIAVRRIKSGEELTYDYKFPYEDKKIPCTCDTLKCRKFLN